MKVLRVSLFCIVLFLVAISSFSQERLISSGLLLSGGAGTLDYEFVDDLKPDRLGESFDDTYNYDLHLGYRFRLRQNHWLFWDLDALLGMKSIQKGRLLDFSEIYTQYQVGKRHLNYYIALSPSLNASIYKGLYAGVGAEPTAYFYRSVDSGMGFDLPVTLKIGYDLGCVSIEGSAKIGLLRHSVENLLERNRKKEFLLSIYIPLRKILQ